MNPSDELLRTKTKGIERKNDEKALIKISLKNGQFWEKEYNQGDLIGKVINDFKEVNHEEFPEEYMADWKHKNKSLDLNHEIRTLLVNEVPTLIFDHKSDIKPLTSLGEEVIPDIIGKPFYDPFEIFAFYKNNKILKIQKYDNEEIEKSQLNNYGPSSAYCNGKNHLFISGGEKKNSEIIDKFWIINLENQKIEELIMQPKKNHSMIYIKGNYVFFVGGNNLKTFYYDIEKSIKNDWVDLNKNRIEPSLMLINDYLYCIDNVNTKNNYEFTLEKTNITSEKPEWELIKPDLTVLESQKLNQKFFGVINDKNENILFLGGNMDEDKNEKYNYKYNINNNVIESSNIPFEEYNFKEKTFLPYNNNVDYILPDFNRNHPEVVFYQKNKNKVSLVKYKPNNENKLRAKPKILKKLDLNFNMPQILNQIPTSENKANKEEENNNINIVNEEANINININNINSDNQNNNEKEVDSLKEENNQININIDKNGDKNSDKKSEKNNLFENDFNINYNINENKPLIQDDNLDKNDKNDIINPSGINIEINNPISGNINMENKIDIPTPEIKYTNEPPEQLEYNKNINPVINEEQKIDIHLPSIGGTGIQIDNKNDGKEYNNILLDAKIKEYEINIPGPNININVGDKDKDIGKIDSGLNVNVNNPDLEIKKPKLEINNPNINNNLNILNDDNKLNPEIKIKPSNIELPSGSAKIDVNGPKIDIYSEKYIILSGIIKGIKPKKKEEKLPSAKVDINGPKINSPDINLGGNIDGKNKIELNPPNGNANIDLNLKNSNIGKDIYLSGIIPGIKASSNININNDINDLKINQINLPSGGGELNINNNLDIDGKNNNTKIDAPDINLEKREKKINYPEFENDKPKIDINKDIHEMNFKNPNLKAGINLNGDLIKIKDSNQIDAKLPNVDIKGSKIGEADLNVNLPKIEGKGLDVRLNGPKIDGKGLDINLNGPKIDGKMNESKEVNFFKISGIIEGIKGKKDISESKNTAVKGNIPGISLNAPSVNINGNLPDTKINGPKINTNGIGGNINFKGSNGDLEGIIPGINVKYKNNINLPSSKIDINNPEINHNINGKVVDLNLDGPKIESPNAETNLKGISGAKIEPPKIDINVPQQNHDYFKISGTIPSKNDQNAGIQILTNPPNINIDGNNFNYSNKKNFHGSLNNQINIEEQIGKIQGSKNLNKLNLEGQFDEIKGIRKLENISGNKDTNIQMPKVEIKSNENINIEDKNKIEIGGEISGGIKGEKNFNKNISTKLEYNNDNEDNKYGVNVNINGDMKNENFDMGNLGMNFNNEQKVDTKVVLNSSIGGVKRKGKLPTVEIKKSNNFEPSRIDVAGKFNTENIDIENLNYANVGINGKKTGERIEE